MATRRPGCGRARAAAARGHVPPTTGRRPKRAGRSEVGVGAHAAGRQPARGSAEYGNAPPGLRARAGRGGARPGARRIRGAAHTPPARG